MVCDVKAMKCDHQAHGELNSCIYNYLVNHGHQELAEVFLQRTCNASSVFKNNDLSLCSIFYCYKYGWDGLHEEPSNQKHSNETANNVPESNHPGKSQTAAADEDQFSSSSSSCSSLSPIPLTPQRRKKRGKVVDVDIISRSPNTRPAPVSCKRRLVFKASKQKKTDSLFQPNVTNTAKPSTSRNGASARTSGDGSSVEKKKEPSSSSSSSDSSEYNSLDELFENTQGTYNSDCMLQQDQFEIENSFSSLISAGPLLPSCVGGLGHSSTARCNAPSDLPSIVASAIPETVPDSFDYEAGSSGISGSGKVKSQMIKAGCIPSNQVGLSMFTSQSSIESEPSKSRTKNDHEVRVSAHKKQISKRCSKTQASQPRLKLIRRHRAAQRRVNKTMECNNGSSSDFEDEMTSLGQHKRKALPKTPFKVKPNRCNDYKLLETPGKSPDTDVNNNLIGSSYRSQNAQNTTSEAQSTRCTSGTTAISTVCRKLEPFQTVSNKSTIAPQSQPIYSVDDNALLRAALSSRFGGVLRTDIPPKGNKNLPKRKLFKSCEVYVDNPFTRH